MQNDAESRGHDAETRDLPVHTLFRNYLRLVRINPRQLWIASHCSQRQTRFTIFTKTDTPGSPHQTTCVYIAKFSTQFEERRSTKLRRIRYTMKVCATETTKKCAKIGLYTAGDVVDWDKHRRKQSTNTQTEEHDHCRLDESNERVDCVVHLATVEG